MTSRSHQISEILSRPKHRSLAMIKSFPCSIMSDRQVKMSRDSESSTMLPEDPQGRLKKGHNGGSTANLENIESHVSLLSKIANKADFQAQSPITLLSTPQFHAQGWMTRPAFPCLYNKFSNLCHCLCFCIFLYFYPNPNQSTPLLHFIPFDF